MSSTPKVWVGCLGCYNAGMLIGKWVDATEAGSLTWRDIGCAPPDIYDFHEELWVFDLEGFDGLLEGETSPITAQRIAEAHQAIVEAGHDPAAVAGWADNIGRRIEEWDATVEQDFSDALVGCAETLEAWGAENFDELYEVPEALESYIDTDRWAEELRNEGWYEVKAGDETYIFRPT